MATPILLSPGNFELQNIYNEFSGNVLTPVNLMEMKHEFVVEKMHDIQNQNSHILVEEIGKSVEGRSINMFSFGTGEIKVLLWSQMHGDEATGTAGILSVFNFFSKRFETPFVQRLVQNLSIHAIVMLNPDGSEIYRRRNIQGIDINRDAQQLISSEGQILKKMYERIQPDFGFNLHDMSGNETVGDSGNLLNVALMAPPYNKTNEDSPTRVRAKKLVVIIKKALDNFIKGHVARYKADYMTRAFGDAFQKWNVSTVLIESGSSDNGEPHYRTKLVYTALLTAFDAISSGYVNEADPEDYERIPVEGNKLFDLLIKNALIYSGRNIGPFKGDIGINISKKWSNGKTVFTGTIEDIGDLSITSGRKVITAKNPVVIPGLIFKSEESPQQLFRFGITTPIQNSDPRAIKLSSSPKNGLINSDKISLYTMLPAKSLNLDQKGIIDIGMIADLLIFDVEKHDILSIKDLKYVIKNGEIVYQNI